MGWTEFSTESLRGNFNQYQCILAASVFTWILTLHVSIIIAVKFYNFTNFVSSSMKCESPRISYLSVVPIHGNIIASQDPLLWWQEQSPLMMEHWWKFSNSHFLAIVEKYCGQESFENCNRGSNFAKILTAVVSGIACIKGNCYVHTFGCSQLAFLAAW